jgi:[acyl-carrier-protein] S-malonyltransferase
MQEAVPFGVGGMAAILGLSDEEVRLACAESAQGEVVEPVNFNAPAQVVIAGHKAAVERACEAAKARGAKRALVLAVSAPFHSTLLKPASDRLREYLKQVEFQIPQIPLINNVDVSILSDAAAIKDSLVRQAASPVRWVETIQKMAAMDVHYVIESGPGKVLAGLVRRINSELVGDAVFDDASLSKVLTQLKG